MLKFVIIYDIMSIIINKILYRRQEKGGSRHLVRQEVLSVRRQGADLIRCGSLLRKSIIEQT